MALRAAGRVAAALVRPLRARRQLSAVTRAAWQERVARGPQLAQFLAAAEGEAVDAAEAVGAAEGEADASMARIQRLLRDVRRAVRLDLGLGRAGAWG